MYKLCLIWFLDFLQFAKEIHSDPKPLRLDSMKNDSQSQHDTVIYFSKFFGTMSWSPPDFPILGGAKVSSKP